MLIRNASVYNGSHFIPECGVRIREGGILETGRDLRPEPGEKTADMAGDYLLPGFVDVHIHAFGGRDTMEGEAAVRAMSRELYRLGVSAFCPTTMSADPESTRQAIRGIRAVMDRPEPSGARVLGAHMEAPFLQESRERSNVIGRNVTVIESGRTYPARALDIDSQGRLVIETEKGRTCLNYGEVSLKL